MSYRHIANLRGPAGEAGNDYRNSDFSDRSVAYITPDFRWEIVTLGVIQSHGDGTYRLSYDDLYPINLASGEKLTVSAVWGMTSGDVFGVSWISLRALDASGSQISDETVVAAREPGRFRGTYTAPEGTRSVQLGIGRGSGTPVGTTLQLSNLRVQRQINGEVISPDSIPVDRLKGGTSGSGLVGSDVVTRVVVSSNPDEPLKNGDLLFVIS